MAAIGFKELDNAFENTLPSSTYASAGSRIEEADASKPSNSTLLTENMHEASTIILTALGKHDIRVARVVIGNHQQMMYKLDHCVVSTTIASPI